MKVEPWKYRDNAWNVIVTWSSLRKIDNYFKDPKDDDASLYAVISKDRKNIKYIGMTHRQYSTDRIKSHGYRNCFISIGSMEVLWSRVTKQRVQDAESLLIFVYQPKDNTSKKKWIRPEEDILVENKGLGKYLQKYMYYGTAVSGGA